jgi:type I restriction-modification system DNA methylase subunit
MTNSSSVPKVDIHDIAARLWETADELRANSHLKAAEYSIPVLGLIFLKFADSRFTQAEAELLGKSTSRREIGKADYQAKRILYLPPQSRFANLLVLKEGDNLGKAINDAMAAIEDENPSLKGVLPRTYQSLTNATLVSLLRSVNAILGDIEGDAFGKVYEYFLASSPSPKERRAGSTSRPLRSSGSSSRSSSRSVERSLTLHVARGACSSRALGLWRSIAMARPGASPSTARSGSTRRCACAR